MNKVLIIIISLLICSIDLLLEKPEGLELIGIQFNFGQAASWKKIIYFAGSFGFHLIGCTLIVRMIFRNKNFAKHFFWGLLIAMLIVSPLFYYFNIYLTKNGEERILVISNVYYFLRSPILLLYILPLFFIWSKSANQTA